MLAHSPTSSVNGIENTTRESGFKRALKSLLWLSLGGILITYGLIAFNSGSKLSPITNSTENADKTVAYIMEQAQNGVPMEDSPEASAVLPFWVNLIAKLESSEYVHSGDSIMEAEQHYYSMPDQRRNALSLHMMLGLILMTTGFFQFWPAFRRKHRKLHRYMGGIYVLTGFTSMAMSSYHLLATGVENTYGQYVFYVGLWILVAISVTSMSIAGYAIMKRNIAVHLGWQALAFGCFLTAPIQRIYWIVMSKFSDGATFNEMNIVTNISLIVQAFLASYLLFYINRASSPIKKSANNQSGVVAAGITGKYVTYASILLASILTFMFYITSPGLSSSEFTQSLAVISAVQWHDTILASSLPVLLFGAIAALAITGGRILTASVSAIETMRIVPILVLFTGGLSTSIFLVWGYQLGMPSHERSVAGVFYFYNGLIMLFFLGFFARAFLTQQLGKMKEALWFIVLLAMAPALMYAQMLAFGAFNLVPQPYLQQGHGYQLAAAGALLFPVLIGHLLAVYSPETKRYAIN